MRYLLAALGAVALATAACGRVADSSLTKETTAPGPTTALSLDPLDTANVTTGPTTTLLTVLPEASGVTTSVSVGSPGPDGEFELTVTVFNGMAVTISTMAGLLVLPKSSSTWDDAQTYSASTAGDVGRLCLPDLSDCSIQTLALRIPSGTSLTLSTTSPALEPGSEYLVRLMGTSYEGTGGGDEFATVTNSFIAPE
jgi:hypothetical protein